MKKDIHERTCQFALQIIQVVNQFPKTTAGFKLGKQLFRSGTSVGANLVEGSGSVSKKEFANYTEIAKKSARETEYWLTLVLESHLLPREKIQSALQEAGELTRILVAIVLQTKKNLNP